MIEGNTFKEIESIQNDFEWRLYAEINLRKIVTSLYCSLIEAWRIIEAIKVNMEE